MIVRPQTAEPYAWWNDYLSKHPVTWAELVPNLDLYRSKKRFVDIEAALRAFLRHHTNPEPFLYEMLAVAIAENKGKLKDVQDALGYAADQAQHTNRTMDLTRVADSMAVLSEELKAPALLDRAGPLLDRAMEMEPGNPRPLWMSIQLANRTRSADRMASSVERLLSLGWPDADEPWRAEARRQAEALAKTLREDGRDKEAEKLLQRLAAAEPRDLVLTLTWHTGDADLDLAVTEPLGATARSTMPRTVFGGAIVKNGYGKHREEVYACPLGFSGDYKVAVETLYNDEKDPVREATLTIILHEGTDREKKETRTLRFPNPAPVVVHLDNGRRKTVLPFQAPPTPPPTAPASTTGSQSSSRPKAAQPKAPTAASAADALGAPAPKPAPSSGTRPAPSPKR